MGQENPTITTASDQWTSGKTRTQAVANLEDNEAVGEDTYFGETISSHPTPRIRKRKEKRYLHKNRLPPPSSPPHKKTMTDSTTLSKDKWSHFMNMMAKQLNKIDLMEAQINQMANNPARDIIPKSRAESDRKLSSVCPNLPNNLKEKNNQGILISLQDMKKILCVNAESSNLQKVFTHGENDLFANWTAHLAASLLHTPELMTYKCIADHLKYQAIVCEYSKIMYPEEVANLDKGVGRYFPHSRLSDIDAAKLAVVALSSCKHCNCATAFSVCENVTPVVKNKKGQSNGHDTCQQERNNTTIITETKRAQAVPIVAIRSATKKVALNQLHRSQAEGRSHNLPHLVINQHLPLSPLTWTMT
ncbi:hypothetical protein SARC_08697 [Sphaeroforma arctica JP610]|uniref:Uncharacterized protein n=1 Tax=Sphaeroforma arctica JP610 TaxID=667725 RepID=A0A0L0FSD7_9EUKA|nr:hypothetical protein SARC_08697 [Sphaeroforma arctica JP610]KNC78893.1 hypothetical protein SARC_08697 [Sphaeroforma arctica JP610]|eukprot:XP_014152795.1 hypothetical protein SARC_08697 [Sphaeroforma arctica JP610]